MGDIQLDLLFFINNQLQNPFLDMVVPIIYSITDVRVIFYLDYPGFNRIQNI